MANQWYVAETHPCAEQYAVVHLRRQGFEPFLPTCRVWRVGRGGAGMEHVLPLFPGYLLVPLDLAGAGWRRVNGTRGVRRLLGNNPEWPVPVDDRAMDLLLKVYGDMPVADPRTVVGAMVEFVGGPDFLRGKLGRVTGTSKGRVEVLMSLIFKREKVIAVPVIWLGIAEVA
jgi:transcription antitermination factor NusG